MTNYPEGWSPTVQYLPEKDRYEASLMHIRGRYTVTAAGGTIQKALDNVLLKFNRRK